jgi:hypothetical protein
MEHPAQAALHRQLPGAELSNRLSPITCMSHFHENGQVSSYTVNILDLLHQQFSDLTMCNGPTNALVCNKTLIKMSHVKALKITSTCFDHQPRLKEE